MKAKVNKMTTINVKSIVNDLIKELTTQPYQDISDVGNIIGIVLGKCINENTEEENSIRSFKFGLDHGIDLSENRTGV